MNVSRLVKKAKRGNKDALVQLIMQEQLQFYKLAYTYVGNEHDALDALDQMIVIVYEKMHQLKDNEAFYSWSKTILVNECRALLKRKNRVTFLDDEETPEQAVSPIDHVDNELELEHYLAILSPAHKEAVQLKYLLDFDYETIAELTNVSVGTAKTRVFYALKKLRAQFGEENFHG